MKKFDIPLCLLGLGDIITYDVGRAFLELIYEKMANFGLTMPLLLNNISWAGGPLKLDPGPNSRPSSS